LNPENTRNTRERMIAQFLSGMDPLVTAAGVHLRSRDVPSDRPPGSISGFKRRGEETVEKRPARVLEYTIEDSAADRTRYSVRLWIDSGTGLPIQRTAAAEGTTFEIREVFKTFELTEERPWVPTPGKK
jgi:hypothetical protein